MGELRAHQIGMASRIVYVFLFAGLLLTLDTSYSTLDLLYIGLFWLILTLAVEWGGSLLTADVSTKFWWAGT